MSESIVKLLKYIKGNTGPCTKCVPRFIWFWSIVVELWMNEVLQVTKMVLSLKQHVFIVKQYQETHPSKHVRDDFIQEFPNSASPSYHAIINVIKKHVMIYHTWHDRLWWPQRGWRRLQKMSPNTPDIITTTGTAGLQVGLSHASTCHTLHFLAYPYKISIQLEFLKPVDSPKRVEFFQWFCRYVCVDVFVFDTFFFSDEARFHLDGYIEIHKIIVFGVRKTLTFFE